MNKIPIIFALTLLAAGFASAAIPNIMNLQGRLTDASTVAVNGTQNFTLRIFDAYTGGNNLWTETQRSVNVSGGIFSIDMGSLTPLNLTFNADYWVQIEVTGENLTPRRRISSVAYAFRANISENLTCVSCVKSTYIENVDASKVNAGTFGTGNFTFPNNLTALGIVNSTGTSFNNTFYGDIRINGTLYGFAPLRIGTGLNITGDLNVTGGTVNFPSGLTTFNGGINGINMNFTGSTNFATSGGLVGIGTATPYATLYVTGNGTFTNNLSVVGNLTGYQLNFTGYGDFLTLNVRGLINTQGVNSSSYGDFSVLNIRGITTGINVNYTGSVNLASLSGRVGILNNLPNATLHITGLANVLALNVNDSLYVNTTKSWVGIGTRSPTYPLDVETNNTNLVASFINRQTGDNSGGVLIQGGTNSGNEALNVKTTSGGQLFLVDASGETYVSTATDSGAYNLQVAGNICETDTSVSACSSDARLKENIQPLNSGLNLILSLEPKTFNFIGDSKTHAGLIAQDVQANPLTSNWIQQHDSDIYMTWDDSDYLKFSMIKAIQELKAENDGLKQRISALEQKVK